MESTHMWSDGPVGDEAAASGGLLRLLGGAEPGTAADGAGAGVEVGGAEPGAETYGAEPGAAAYGAEPGAEVGGAGRRVVTGPLVCRYCAWDRFEVTSDECFCEGCCLPLDVQHEDGCGAADPVVLELRPPTTPSPVTDMNMVTCPAGHDLFQVAAAYTLGPDGSMRRLSVGLRCPVDGALSLVVDDVRMTRSPSARRA
ncbi:hypothetical protein [Streptomyces sp. NPDC056480]|uniref:hypothetical protein n=1 Tax=Streptomyces sp. NPDC056480 TaxID=3345833 RepID=UPI0036A2B84D